MFAIMAVYDLAPNAVESIEHSIVTAIAIWARCGHLHDGQLSRLPMCLRAYAIIRHFVCLFCLVECIIIEKSSIFKINLIFAVKLDEKTISWLLR